MPQSVEVIGGDCPTPQPGAPKRGWPNPAAPWSRRRAARIALMGDEKGLKSSYELAMERLRKKDEESGIERRPVTDAQKAAIGEIRNFYEAKIAEQEVLHQGRMRATLDPGERATLEEHYRRDRDRLVSERDAKIEKARTSAAP